MKYLQRLEEDLVSDKCNRETNLKLLAVVLLFFFIQQFVELLILLHLNLDYFDLCKWDCIWYRSIATSGYDHPPFDYTQQRNIAFFPLFPLIAKALNNFGFASNFSLILTSKIFFFLAIFTFIKIGKKYFPEISILTTGAIIAFNPYTIYANSGYTESLFLFLTCCSFYFMRQKKYLACGIFGGFLSATRVVGISILTAYAFFNFKDLPRQKIRIILGGLLMSLGLFFFMFFLQFHTGDALVFLKGTQAWGRSISNPFSNLWLGFKQSPFFLISALMTLGALAACFYLAFKKHYELAIFSFCCTMIPLSSGILISMPRYLWFQAPLLLVMAKIFHHTLTFSAVILFLLSAMTYIYFAWLLGYGFLL